MEAHLEVPRGQLSGHLLATPPESGNFSSSIRGYSLPWYHGELLTLAHDLGRRLLPAFATQTGIPFARIHLQKGLRGGKSGKAESAETCSAGTGDRSPFANLPVFVCVRADSLDRDRRRLAPA